MRKPEQQTEHQPEHRPPPGEGHRRRRGAGTRFVRGYLMLVGAGTTIYLLVRVIVVLLVEAQSWRTLLP